MLILSIGTWLTTDFRFLVKNIQNGPKEQLVTTHHLGQRQEGVQDFVLKLLLKKSHIRSVLLPGCLNGYGIRDFGHLYNKYTVYLKTSTLIPVPRFLPF